MPDAEKKTVIVVGGGLAGIACAVALAKAGVRVMLLESRFALGGRAGSFEDGDGALLDNCQHVLLGCCTNLIDLYRRLGVSEKVRFHRSVHFLDGRGKRHDLWAVSGLPAPLHLGLSFALFSALTLGERVAVARAMREMLRIGKSGRNQLEGVAFGEWLDRMKQPAGLVHKFYDPVLISALNEETRRVSAKYAIQVFQDAMLAHREGFVVGLPACPLGELYATVPGVEVRVNTRVEEVVFERNSEFRVQNSEWKAVAVRLRGGEELRGDAVVLATNHHAVQRWIPEELKSRDARFAGLEKLESVPILGAHLWFDRPIMREEAVALIEGPLQWLFRKDAEGRVLHGVISAARAWPAVAKEQALRQFEAQVRSLFPAAREAKLERGVIVIEKRATFSPLPGTDQFRPSQAPPPGGIASLFLAGDYTKSDWPATMEGAVRSGYLAAEAVLGAPMAVVADLPVQWLARVMGLAR
ncbi:MAG TPA: hydroxysqualene dehydroxylase HpnE [Phycisphaerae bacterium]|nr:hydroxysqualene dehydroxylase HpnE [Phycisphaerae bacterium]